MTHGLKQSYLWLQTISVSAWWFAVWLTPAARDWFMPISAPSAYLWSFLPGDLLLVVVGSAVAARSWRAGPPPPVLWVTAGALWFGSVYVCTLAVSGEMGWAAAGLMIAASGGTGLVLFDAPK